MKLPLWVRRQLKKKPRIYIFPTRMGGYLNGLIFLMFLLSIGYNNNLLLIFTLFLFALNLLWVIQTHFYLHALKLDSVFIHDGHAGEKCLVRFNWKKMPGGPHKWHWRLENDGHSLAIDFLDNSTGELMFSQRGIWSFEHLFVKTEMPFGLYQVWVYFPVRVRAYAYPSRIKNPPVLKINQSMSEGEHSTLSKGPHDVWNLGPYEDGEARKISWKHYARSGELVVKEGEDLRKAEVIFRLKESVSDKEKLLSEIATQMLVCVKNDTSFGLETPEKKIPAGFGEMHLYECLRMLAIC